MKYIISRKDIAQLIQIYKVVIKLLANDFPKNQEVYVLQKFCNNLDESLSEFKKKNTDLFNWTLTDYIELESSTLEIDKEALKQALSVYDNVQSICYRYHRPVAHFTINDSEEGMEIET